MQGGGGYTAPILVPYVCTYLKRGGPGHHREGCNSPNRAHTEGHGAQVTDAKEGHGGQSKMAAELCE